MSEPTAKPAVQAYRVLCVDDEPAVLEGLELLLSRRYRVSLASGGTQALAALERDGPFAVVISDMRMPGMNGAQLLSTVRQRAPQTIRILLTGYSELEAAAQAINEGQIFRFLTKPCPPEALRTVLDDAIRQHRLLCAEKELLEQTLRGAVGALCEVLSVADPHAFGRNQRLRELVAGVANEQRLEPFWPLDLATQLLGLGRVSLPIEVARKLNLGLELSADETAMVARVPELTDRLLAPIPRLEGVREIQRLALDPKAKPALGGDIEQLKLAYRCAMILRLCLRYDELITRGLTPSEAGTELRGETVRPEEQAIVTALYAAQRIGEQEDEVRSLRLRDLRAGMVLAEDLHSSAGQLLVKRGYHITATFIERLRNLRAWSIREPVLVVIPQRRADDPEEDEDEEEEDER